MKKLYLLLILPVLLIASGCSGKKITADEAKTIHDAIVEHHADDYAKNSYKYTSVEETKNGDDSVKITTVIERDQITIKQNVKSSSVSDGSSSEEKEEHVLYKSGNKYFDKDEEISAIEYGIRTLFLGAPYQGYVSLAAETSSLISDTEHSTFYSSGEGNLTIVYNEVDTEKQQEVTIKIVYKEYLASSYSITLESPDYKATMKTTWKFDVTVRNSYL